MEIEELVTIIAATRFREHASTHLTGAPQMFPKTPDDKHRNDFNLFFVYRVGYLVLTIDRI